jgi:hypothetical protein
MDSRKPIPSRLFHLYNLIGQADKSSTIKPDVNLTPDQILSKHLTNDTIALYPDAFFSKWSHVETYICQNDIIKTMQLFDSYGREFKYEREWNLIFTDKDENFNQEYFDYFISNYAFEIDWIAIARELINFMFLDNNYDKFEKAIECCATNLNITIHDMFENYINILLDEKDSKPSINPIHNFLKYSQLVPVLSKHPAVQLNINNILSRISKLKIRIKSYAIYLIGWLEDGSIDYADPSIVDIVFSICDIAPTMLKVTLEKFVATGVYDETIHKEHLLWSVVYPITYGYLSNLTADQNGRFDYGPFIEYFCAYGVDIDALFNSHMFDGSEDVPSYVTNSRPLMEYFAVKYGLL